MKGVHTFFILTGILVGYIFLVNIFAGLLAQSASGTSSSASPLPKGEPALGVNVGVSESVHVTVVRQRFYGKIIEMVGESTVSYLYLFNFLKLPLQAGKINFLYFHGGMLILFFALLIVLSRLER